MTAGQSGAGMLPAYTPPVPASEQSAYNHSEHFRRCKELADLRREVLGKPHIQVKFQGVTHCAQLVVAWTTKSGQDMWAVDLLSPQRCRASVPAHMARLCSGLDGHCLCAGEAGAGESVRRGPACGDTAPDSPGAVTPVFFQAGVVAPPEGLISENPHVVDVSDSAAVEKARLDEETFHQERFQESQLMSGDR